jgi:hypothetical protein
VMRIERQRALFLDTSHPDLLEQYVAHSVWFRQVDGVTFEDLDAEWPVSKAHCYPELDPTLEVLQGLGTMKEAVEAVSALAPPSDASHSLRAADYVAIAQSWCEQDGVVLQPAYVETLGRVCLVHSLLQEHRDHLSVELRSLHRLKDATTIVLNAQKSRQEMDVVQAMRRTLRRSMTEAEREILNSLVVEAITAQGVPVGATDLPAYVSRLLGDLTPHLAELVVIGAADAAEERVRRDIEALLGDQGFRVFDLRGASDTRGIGALAADIGDAVRLLLVDRHTAGSWLRRLTRAFLDGTDRIVFEGGWVERSPRRSIVIVWYGAAEIADLPPLLREPIVQFVA